MSGGFAFDVGSKCSHERPDDLRVDMIGIESESDRIAGQVDTAVGKCVAPIVLPDVGIDDDTFFFIVPAASDVGIAKQSVVVGKAVDVQVVSIDGRRFRQKPGGVEISGGISAECDMVDVESAENITEVDVLELNGERFFVIVGNNAVDFDKLIFLIDVESVHMNFFIGNMNVGLLDAPYRVVYDKIRRIDADVGNE